MAKKETDDVMKKINRAPKVSDFKFRREGVTSTKGNYNSKVITIDGKNVRNRYYDLIKEKSLKNEVKWMDKIVDHRAELLQPRTNCTLHLLSGGNVVATLEVFETLIEHEESYADYWIGLKISPYFFKQLVESFKNKMRSLSVSNVEISLDLPRDSKPVIVTGIETEFTFA